MGAVAESFFLVLFGTVAWWTGKLLFDPRKRVHHLLCRMHRSPYPPHPEDWVITHHIRLVLFVIGTFFVSALIGLIGSLAGLALAIMS